MSSSPYIQTVQPYTLRDEPLPEAADSRLKAHGPDALTVNELLRVALGGENPVETKVAEYGTGFLKTVGSVADIQAMLDVDEVTAERILAILGIGKRLYSPPSGSFTQIRSIEDVFAHCRPMANLPTEQLRVLLINSRYQLVHEETIAVGEVEGVTVSPRTIFQPAVERRVTAIILVHNHPSGDPTPSQHDRDFTVTVKAAGELLGIDLLDHVVIWQERYASCLPTGSTPSDGLPVTTDAA